MTFFARNRPLWLALILSLAAGCEPSEQTTDAPECAAPCVTPPAPSCDATSAITYNPQGSCVDAVCQYQARREDCSAIGATCVDGRCEDVRGDPCADVSCEDAPAPDCAEGVAVTFASPGTCVVEDERAACIYEEIREDCVAAGTECVRGGCEPLDPCADVVCDSAPPPVCEGGEAVSFAGLGTCAPESGECEYASERTDCEAAGLRCAEGVCVPPDPCADIDCFDAPEDTCEGDDLVRWASTGECIDGSCDYRFDRVECATRGQVCRAARCTDPEPCDGVVCDRPPAPTCRADVAVTFPEIGNCEEGICVYLPADQDCGAIGEVCVDGGCVVPDECTGVVCTTPPPSFCRAEVAVGYALPGTCSDGDCSYEEETEDCAASSGRCVVGECEADDPCAAVTCTVPPPAECDGDLSVIYSLPGACDDGVCSYFVAEEDCTEIGGACVDGFCETPDRCESVSCEVSPPNRCEGTVLVEYFGRGICDPDTGECDFSTVEDRVDCADDGLVCIAAACVGPGAAFGEGELLITEFMADPAEGLEHQWFEVRDMVGGGELGGLIVQNASGTASFEVPMGVALAPEGTVVFGASDAAAGGRVDVVWGGPAELSLTPTGDAIELRGIDVVDRVEFDGTWPCATDVACALGAENLYEDNAESSAWCAAVDEDGEGWFGTPGEANPACVATFGPGHLVINEVMVDGLSRPGGREQWVELLNTTANTLDISGLRLESGTTQVLVPWGTTLAPGAYFVASYDDLSAGGGGDLWFFDDLVFATGGDSITLRLAGTEIDRVDFSDGSPPWPFAPGVSMQLRSTELAGTDPASWCAASTSYESAGVSNSGTPGLPNVCD